MAAPARYTFRVYQGQTWEEPLLLKNADGTAMNLTGYEARMHVREDIADAATVLELNGGNSRLVVTAAAAGEITISVSAGDMAELPLAFDTQTWVYDLEIFLPAVGLDPEKVYRVLEGSIIAYPEVTRV